MNFYAAERDAKRVESKFGETNIVFCSFLLFKTRNFDFFAPYIGEKLRDFPREFNPNTEKLTLTFVLLTPTSNK